jgi:Protein of unknown function (DUF2934)
MTFRLLEDSMDVSSASGSTKKRARVKTATKAPAAALKAERKTVTAKKKALEPEPVMLEALSEPVVDLTATIATAAFYLAAERNFAPGRELDDWLEAERRIRGIP